ncbi:glycosyltransferase [Catellatospora sp. NPDC049609]|uniref:glycosyltransferase n=1 Tax=Catellatospora sp. NPDC049609 TaxID=3155505 RepID=UPI00342E4E18
MDRLADAVADLHADAQFTAALDIPETRQQVSALLATYNRCPADPDTALRDNPLTWALDSLLAQAGQALAEIVVVDDGSTDHTAAVLEHYRSLPGPVPVRVLRLAHRGAWAARNAAVAAAEAPWLLFGDDDCVFQPHFAAGAAYALQGLWHRDPHAAAVMTPVYYRALAPREIMPIARIGRLDPPLAEFSTRFNTWPVDYLPQAPLLDSASGLVDPFPVQIIGGTALVTADALHRAGGFTDLSMWPTSYSDHLHLSADLADAGAGLCHCPDPRIGSAHLKYGAVSRYPLHDDDLRTILSGVGRALGELVDLSARPRVDTGCRVADGDFHADMIGSWLAFFAGRSLDGGAAWGRRMWTDFVQGGQVYSQAIAVVPPLDERVTAWREGLARGARALVAPTARPARTAAEVDGVLWRVTDHAGQPPITW